MRVLSETHRRVEVIAAALPDPLGTEIRRVFEPYLARNLQRDPPRNIVLAVAYDQGIRDLEVLVQLSVVTVIGGMHSLVLDDIVDNKGQANRPWYDVYVSHVLYVLHQDLLQQISSDDWLSHGRPATLDAQLSTYGALVEEEKLHVGISTPYHSPEIVWRKCAPVKAVIERVLALSGKYGIKPSLDKAADLACFALCTLDDMLDWPADYAQRRFTYPLQRALDNIGESWSSARHEELSTLIGHELVFGTTHHALMAEITSSLERAISIVTPISPQLAGLLTASHNGAESSWKNHLQYLSAVEQRLPTSA
jgi:hypothetical protein